MLNALTARNEWKFLAILPRADRMLAVAWWIVLVLRGVLPALFAIAIGVLVGAVRGGGARRIAWGVRRSDHHPRVAPLQHRERVRRHPEPQNYCANVTL